MDRPWWQESNSLDFEADGLRCAMRRGPLGAWCGYVGIPKSHPWFGKSYNESIKPIPDMLGPRDSQDHNAIDLFCMALSNKDPSEALDIGLALRVHGGITYAENHAPYSEPDGLWWYGFDCSHCDDLIPSMAESRDFKHLYRTAIYRDQAYVVSECQSLAAQLVRYAVTYQPSPDA